MMCPPVRVIEAGYVAVPPTITPSPEPIKLTAMEAQWVSFFPVLQHVLLFEFDLEGRNGAANIPHFDTLVESLRSSLAATLSSFAPLAGKLVYLKDTGDVGISCSSTDGVRFVVAECDADVQRLCGDEEHDVSVLRLLVPEVDMSELPARVVAVQATRFQGGKGMALGVTVHHAVADGRSLWRFVEAWAKACRGGDTVAAAPTFDRSLVNVPDGVELARSVLRKRAPNLPLATPPWPVSTPGDGHHGPFSRRWTFTLQKRDIERIGQRIARSNGAAPLPRPPSAFVVIAALTWTCFARCKPFAADDDVFFFFFADVRSRLKPPVHVEYIGTCLTGCLARLPARELRDGEHALAVAASAVQDEVRKMTEDPMAGWDFVTSLLAVDMARLMHVSGSTGFRAYEVADFGWGKPRRTENARMNDDGQVALMRAKDGHGVQASLSLLSPAQMDEFKAQFLKVIQG